jgi:peptidoglycan/LPS O-acetylase OafA/YrhL
MMPDGRTQPWNRLWLRRLLFWAAAIFAFVMAILPHPPELPGEPSDKVQHMAAFATLGVLGAWAYFETSVLQLLAGLSLFGAMIELVQAIPAIHRDSDVKDWIADTLACGAVLLLVRWRRARKRGETGPSP